MKPPWEKTIMGDTGEWFYLVPLMQGEKLWNNANKIEKLKIENANLKTALVEGPFEIELTLEGNENDF